MSFLGFLGIGMSIFLVVLLVLWIRSKYLDKQDPNNPNILINGLSDYNGGYGLLVEESSESNQDESKIVALPRDIDYIKSKDKDFKINKQTIFVKKRLIVPLGFSNNRNDYMILPDRAEDLPAKAKQSPLFPYIAKFIEGEVVKEDIWNFQKMREKGMTKFLEEADEGGLKRMGRLIDEELAIRKDTLPKESIKPEEK
jgi:hypothetical protein